MAAALRESEERYRLLFQNANDAVWVCEVSSRGPGRFLEVNDKACKMLGYPRKELLSMAVPQIDTPEQQQRFPVILRQLDQTGSIMFETEHVAKSGRRIPVEVSVRQFTLRGRTLHLAVVRDITDRRQAESLLKGSLAEKETLLRELYHRTKNNMQVISAMLNLQSQYTADATVRKVFREIENRIQAMALVHQKLYESGNLSRIDLGGYLRDLAGNLRQSYHEVTPKVQMSFALERVDALIDTAVPCGIVANELIVNSLKHGFPGGRAGTITVNLRREGDDIVLSVADNGLGMALPYDPKKSGSLGLKVVFNIVRGQLKGSIDMTSERGVRAVVRYKDDLYSERV